MKTEPRAAILVENRPFCVNPLPASPDAVPGARYECLLGLDQGSSGCAYLAIDHDVRSGSQLVALHLADAAIAKEAELLTALRERVLLSRQLHHPNIVRTFDVVNDGHLCFWLTEFVPGQTLARVLDLAPERSLPLNQQLLILREVLSGLEYAHQFMDASRAPCPVIHRNLCPSRVLVDYSGNVKICDYALGMSGDITFGRFDGGAVHFPYFAPERCIGTPVDPRWDVYAVGAMLWEALCGRPRQFGSNLQEALQLRMQDREPRIEQVCPDVPHELAEVADRALAWPPDHRYQTAREFRVELDAYLSSNQVALDLAPLGAFLQLRFGREQAALQQLLRERSTLVRVQAAAAIVAPAKVSVAIEPSVASKGTRMGQSSGRWRRRSVQLAAAGLGGALTLSALAMWLAPKRWQRPPEPAVLAGQAQQRPIEGAASAERPDTTRDDEPARAILGLRPSRASGESRSPSSSGDSAASDLAAQASDAVDRAAGAAPSAAEERLEDADEDSSASSKPVKAQPVRRSQGPRVRAGKIRAADPAALGTTARTAEQADARRADEAIVSSTAPGPSSPSAGTDLRAQNRRAPRPIETRNPYSP